MLSETLALRNALRTCGFHLPEVLEQPGHAPGYRVILNEDGTPTDVIELTAEEMAGLWTIRDGKHNSFPVVKMQQALLLIPPDAPLRIEIEKLTKHQNAARVQLLCQAAAISCSASSQLTTNVLKRLREKARELLHVFDDGTAEFAALPEMLRRFGESKRSAEDVLGEIAKLVADKLRNGRLTNGVLAQKLLIGKINKKKPNEPARAEVPVVFDVSETTYGITVIDRSMQGHVSRCLAGRSVDPTEVKGRCSLTGDEEVLETQRFPAPNLKVLGETYLVSMNEAVPCQQRYGLTGPRIVPVGRKTAKELQQALKFITSPDLKGKTWRAVASGKYETSAGRKRERSDLLIVYLESQPVPKVRLAEITGVDLADPERRLAKQQQQFEDIAQKVCDALRAIAQERPKSKLRLVLLRKIDKGKVQVALAESPTVEQVFNGVEQWRRAVYSNLPSITLPFPTAEKGRPWIMDEPHPPFPEQVVRMLAEQWVTMGRRAIKSEGVGLGDVLDLMLRVEGKWKPTAVRMLALLLRRYVPLLIGVFGANHANDLGRWKDFPPASREVALQAAAVLGILLDAVGRRKENYMAGQAFLVGRLLALADTLHREYCVHVRDGKIPPQLIGNALMPVAADNPQAAVDRLRERMNIYKAWATKADGEEYRLAKWSVGQMGEVCHALSALSVPSRNDQAARAELFLGYMARSPKTST